jgi:NAD(P)-dependent dehydrogenase (short-subunit alcohol dehydrogenase family)
MQRNLEARIVCITGGTGALGRAVVERFAAAGARCFVTSRREDSAGDAGDIRTIGGVDLASEDSVREFYDAVSAEGPIWASLHLAGGFAMADIEAATAEMFMDQFKTNALSCFLCCREAIRRMRQTGDGGRIVNVAARPALEPRTGAGMSAYTASKAAVAALTQALAQEVAADSIWVNAVAPSIIDTPANRSGQPNADYRRWPKPAEIAETILFLASPENQTTRGALTPVYGMF